MNIRPATAEEISNWNMLVARNPDGGNMLHMREFAAAKQLGGWTPLYYMADTTALLILQKKVPVLGKVWYLPKGPAVDDIRGLDQLLPVLRQIAAAAGAFMLKVEPPFIKTDETMADLLKMGLQSVRFVQPSSTVLLDISPDLDAILASLPQKGRHAIRRAERDGVTVAQVEPTEENCRIMYDLWVKTAAGQFSIRSYDFYRLFWQSYASSGAGQLFFASFQGQVVAGAYAVVCGAKSTYKDGASVRERPAYGASHLLQWHVIQWAKENGSKEHDLCGVPPSDKILDTTHPFYGLGRFKTSFNKHVTDYVGAFDVVIKPGAYKIWAAYGERIVRKLHYIRRHESYY